MTCVRSSRRITWLLPLLLLLPAAPGVLRAEAPLSTPRPFLLHLPGIAGECRVDHALLRGLSDGGLLAQVSVYDWTGKDRGLPALSRYRENRAQAKKIAQRLVEQVRARPAEKVILTAHSGGAGLAVWALEQLPDDVMVDELYLLAPALSPGYDLSRALRHVRKAYAFNSEYDGAILGLGTRVFGTIDRVQSDAAGRVGFRPPEDADSKQYAKLVQVPYDPAWMSLGNVGDHIGVMGRAFARSYLAPLMLTGQAPVIAPPATRPVSD